MSGGGIEPRLRQAHDQEKLSWGRAGKTRVLWADTIGSQPGSGPSARWQRGWPLLSCIKDFMPSVHTSLHVPAPDRSPSTNKSFKPGLKVQAEWFQYLQPFSGVFFLLLFFSSPPPPLPPPFPPPPLSHPLLLLLVLLVSILFFYDFFSLTNLLGFSLALSSHSPVLHVLFSWEAPLWAQYFRQLEN